MNAGMTRNCEPISAQRTPSAEPRPNGPARMSLAALTPDRQGAVARGAAAAARIRQPPALFNSDTTC